MPKFIITYITMTPDTRRRAGKSKTFVVEHSLSEIATFRRDFESAAKTVERVFESRNEDTKVIDVRPV